MTTAKYFCHIDIGSVFENAIEAVVIEKFVEQLTACMFATIVVSTDRRTNFVDSAFAILYIEEWALYWLISGVDIVLFDVIANNHDLDISEW